jgi:hypothetical protein
MTINGSGTITGLVAGGLPDSTITQPELAAGVASTGPAFIAYATTSQTPTPTVNTKVTFPTEEFDTNNNFASSTFTPTVSGYYSLSTGLYFSGTGTKLLLIYKNGSVYAEFGRSNDTSSASLSGNIIAYANGSTDYFEIYCYVDNGQVGDATRQYKWFTGSMIRSA